MKRATTDFALLQSPNSMFLIIADIVPKLNKAQISSSYLRAMERGREGATI